jgi:multidrug resistance efflux pump
MAAEISMVIPENLPPSVSTTAPPRVAASVLRGKRNGAVSALVQKMRLRQSLLLGLLGLLAGFISIAGTGPAFARADEPFQAGGGEFRVAGRLVPRQFANLALRLDGRVEEVLVQAGDPVEAGQVLVRLGGAEVFLAGIANAQMDRLLARQALDGLYENAALQKAQAARELAGARKELSDAEGRLARLLTPASRGSVDQAYANLLLAEKALDRAKDDLSRAERQFANGRDPIWTFVSKREARLLLTTLERNVAAAQRRYEDSRQKYQDLLAPPDEVDLAVAEAALVLAQSRAAEAGRKLALLASGPDPDELALAQARLRAAEAALKASESALQDLELHAPFAGSVVDVDIKPGEWASAGEPVVVLVGLSEWIVETEDLTEDQVLDLEAGQDVAVIPDALPDLSLPGVVESVSKLAEIKAGDVTYTAKIRLAGFDPRLRWGMNVTVLPTK